MRQRPLLLVVLDGWGYSESSENNAIKREGAYFSELLGRYPHTLLSASGKEVGLPLGLMGNSEVGHLNLGAGRVVHQDISRINQAIADRSFFELGALTAAMDRAASGGRRLHIMGLVSDGGVHSSDQHLRTLLEMAAERGVPSQSVFVHAFLDGRDTPPRSGAAFLRALEDDLAAAGVGRVASVIGRYYAMDRDTRWERTALAHDLFSGGRGTCVDTSAQAIEASYAADVGDEFVQPHCVGAPNEGRIRTDDEVLCFNFRSDRMRQIVLALSDDAFTGFERQPRVKPSITTMTSYRRDYSFPVAFPPEEVHGIFPELISQAGLSQVRAAETEKYAHVTFFFSGGREEPLPGEERILIPSPKVATYDLQPEMSAPELTEALLASLRRDETDVYIVNFANADMVGHTGIFEAACRAVRTVDACLARIVPEVTRRGGLVAITADHGNSEQLWDPKSDQPHTAHTTNPVPIVFCANELQGQLLRPAGLLADVAPTLLEVAGLQKSPGMDGVSLFA
ncbi:MAG: 2,3-bisphosphoglycerate-independent phosphoglycerate mutase [Planctomycetota bacterium]|jgi:2,3-bisphosphoglycerate-independent phosphoglycerate mutase|nr:2,3-bisphosphoglycerate-independent phosphoglycerate mutase [Planctomycetota bacterium]MDP6838221.1 2,3-bisphosphoglycerate-independent phosphoglycerate mutase [Planctomycetota bacterium]MDP6956792.1 2,3-bisphosphoglycerate-independent phosphoglycerate mutase [Planctomycetota bacterium]